MVTVSSVLPSWDGLRLCHSKLVQNQLRATHASCGVTWDRTTDSLASGIWRLSVSPLWLTVRSKPCPVSKLLQSSSCSCCREQSQSGTGLLHKCSPCTLEWAAAIQSRSVSGGTCPPWLCSALLQYVGPGLEPGMSRLPQCWRCTHPGAVQDKPHGQCGCTFLNLLHLCCPPSVFLLHSYITEGTKHQEMFLASFLHWTGNKRRERREEIMWGRWAVGRTVVQGTKSGVLKCILSSVVKGDCLGDKIPNEQELGSELCTEAHLGRKVKGHAPADSCAHS